MTDLIEVAFENDSLVNGKARLIRALLELSAEKPFHEITVLDICKKARVSRRTFYRHFENKYAAVQWYWHQAVSKYAFRVGRDFDWHESLLRTFQIIYSSLYFFSCASLDGGYESLQSFGCRDRIESLRSTIIDYLGLELTDELDFQIVFFAEAEPRMIVRAARNTQGTPDAEHITDLLESCVPKELHDLLNAPFEHQPQMRRRSVLPDGYSIANCLDIGSQQPK